MAKLINLTPHPVTLINLDTELTIPSSGIARVEQKTEPVGTITIGHHVVRLTKTVFGKETNGLPDPDGNLYIVSMLVCQANPTRDDLYIVNETVRDEEGRIVGAKSLAQNPFLKLNKKSE